MADAEEPCGTTFTIPVCSADNVFPRVCSHACVPTCVLDLRFTDFLHHCLALHGGIV